MLCLLIVVFIEHNVHGQSLSTLFEAVENVEQVLNAKERQAFGNLSGEKVKEKTLINVSGIAAVLENRNATVSVKGMPRNLERVAFEPKDVGNFTYKGRFTEALGELYLYKTNGFLYGNIHIDSLAYQIEPVNTQYAVLLRRDYSGEVCPLGEAHSEEDESNRNKKDGSSKSKSTFLVNPVIDVMVVFSNQAAAVTADMGALAQGSIQSSNDSFFNSDADVSFNLVHYQQVSYSESGSATTDHSRLLGTSDGYMDNIHS
jgi:hypothetical protein